MTNRDDGLTLIEVLVSMVVLSIVVAITGPTLISAMRATNRLEATQDAIADARQISARLDRELRSAVCISSPGENQSGNTLTFRTLTDGEDTVVTYRVAEGQVTRQEGVGGETLVITKVGVTAAAFFQAVTPLRTVRVVMPIKSDNGKTFLLQTTIAGRNAWRSC